MSRRLAAIGLVPTVALTFGAPLAPAQAHSEGGNLLGAPPRHAPAGVCYAHVRREARYAPPPGLRAAWRLSPPPPGAPGPVWCLVAESSRAPPLLIAAERSGWVRVVCATRRGHAARDASVSRWADRRLMGETTGVSLRAPSQPSFIPAVPPPVVRLIPLNPAATYGLPGPHVLTWPGKTAR